jgi:hypothetical protein
MRAYCLHHNSNVFFHNKKQNTQNIWDPEVLISLVLICGRIHSSEARVWYVTTLKLHHNPEATPQP